VRRVLRGGSWNNNENNTRCARRNRNNPNNRNNNIGFRIVVVSHIAADLPEMRSGYGWTAEALRDGPTASLAESGSGGARPGEYKRGPAPWLIPEPDHPLGACLSAS
jgi:hypothetical protein